MQSQCSATVCILFPLFCKLNSRRARCGLALLGEVAETGSMPLVEGPTELDWAMEGPALSCVWGAGRRRE